MTSLQPTDLTGQSILVVEDVYLIADEMVRTLKSFGVKVVGPAGSVDRAMALIKEGGRLDGAVLDINLRGDMAYPIADMLMRREVPFLFTTGYEEDIVQDEYANVPRCEKPIEPGVLQTALRRLLSKP